MSAGRFDFSIGIGGAAGQGIATPGDILARIFVRRGLHLCTYNAYQSIIRGGHIFLTVRVSDKQIYSHGDRLDLLLCLNQDTMDRHLRLMGPGTWVIYNSDSIQPGEINEGVQLCPMPVAELTNKSRNKLAQNTVALGVITYLLGLEFEILAESLTLQFQRKGQALVEENVAVARAGFDYARENFKPSPNPIPRGPKPLAVWSGNEAVAMGGAAAGVKFYCAYPMSPSTGILHWMARYARELDIMVRQVEDEIAVANMAIGAAHAGCRAMCATSGGGFALMTEAVGSAGMMEIPVVFIDVQRAGPSTGVPTKTEQGDLWQVLGASQGDFERFIVAPKNALDAFNTMPELFNLVDRCQCPGIVLSDLLIGEGRYSVDPDDINLQPKIDRGELITEPRMDVDDLPQDDGSSTNGGSLIGRPTNGYLRYEITDSGISPRALPGLQGYVHVVATDEHDEDGVLISDMFTNPHKRRRMVEKRARKFRDVVNEIEPPKVEGPEEAEVTLIGWGSTYGVIREAVERLTEEGIAANHLPIKWIVPFHVEAVTDVMSRAKRTVVVENNYSGQFFRYLRSETGLNADGFIRKYDGEPFMPHHIVDGVRALLDGKTTLYVPDHEIMV
jgi:2-oxoglutarate ferredoxin oxidoreductase subunit alpha